MRWISIKDKLPQEDENVLMANSSVGGLPLRGWYEEGIGFLSYELHSPIPLDVTHWMTLPVFRQGEIEHAVD